MNVSFSNKRFLLISQRQKNFRIQWARPDQTLKLKQNWIAWKKVRSLNFLTVLTKKDVGLKAFVDRFKLRTRYYRSRSTENMLEIY